MTGKNNKQDDPVMNSQETERMDDMIMEDIDESQHDTIKKLKKKITLLQQEKKLKEDDLQRARADFLNAKKRLEEEKKSAIIRSNEDLLERLFSVIDSFESASGDKERWESVDEGWRSGMEAVLNQLIFLLKSYDVEQINPLHEQFEPSMHEALSQLETEEEEKDGMINSVIQKGYVRKTGDEVKVLRPARVSVTIYKD